MLWLCVSVTEDEDGYIALFRLDTAEKHFMDFPCKQGEYTPGVKYKMPTMMAAEDSEIP
jgi:hypothetical protein